jgi:hypothetical protein
MKRRGNASRTDLESQAVDRVEILESRYQKAVEEVWIATDQRRWMAREVWKKKVGVEEWEREEVFIDLGGGQGPSRLACAISLHNQFFFPLPNAGSE